MTGRADEVLDDIDAALDDYVEWHGSDDAASWSADGSHEVDTGGEYYGADIARRPRASVSMFIAASGEQLANADAWARLNAIVGSWANFHALQRRAAEERRRRVAAEADRLRSSWVVLDEVQNMAPWQLERVAEILVDNPHRVDDRLTMARAPRSDAVLPLMPTRWRRLHTTEGDQHFGREHFGLWGPRPDAEPATPATDDARRPRAPRTGRNAQESPYGPRRRGGGR